MMLKREKKGDITADAEALWRDAVEGKTAAEETFEKLQQQLLGLGDHLQRAGQQAEARRFRHVATRLRNTNDEGGLQSASGELVLGMNGLAMNRLAKNTSEGMDDARDLLCKAEEITKASSPYFENMSVRLKYRAVTLNNLGCFHNKCGKTHTALKYLNRALRIEAQNPLCENPAGTHLNLCAILSQLGRHRHAMNHAKCALGLLQFEAKMQAAANANDGSTPPKQLGTSMIAIAHYNIAVEQEHLKQFKPAVISYEKSLDVAKQDLGANHPMTQGVEQSLGNARKVAVAVAKKQLAQKLAKLPLVNGSGAAVPTGDKGDGQRQGPPDGATKMPAPPQEKRKPVWRPSPRR